jgi:hypothetical protein
MSIQVTIENKVTLAKETVRLKELVANLKTQRDDIVKKNQELLTIIQDFADKIKVAAKEAMKNLNLDENLMKDIEKKIDDETQRVIESIPKPDETPPMDIAAVLAASKLIN